MNMKPVMTTPIEVCACTDTLATAARRMGEGGFGFLPVVYADDRLAGVITDRDICLAVALGTRSASNTPVSDAMTRTVFSCLDIDDAHVALAAMKTHRVRRLPVVDRTGRVKGIVSIDDLIVHSADPRIGITDEAIVKVLKQLCSPSRQFTTA
jgi:CBS domain-containing protein